jgi:hypothetical protein
MITINTEDSETTCVLHIHILGATPVSLWSRGSLVRANILLECPFVTVVVTLGRRWCCRVGSWRKGQESRVERSVG